MKACWKIDYVIPGRLCFKLRGSNQVNQPPHRSNLQRSRMTSRSNPSSVPPSLSRVDYIFPYSASTYMASQNPSQFHELDEDEEVWRDRFAFLLQRGLELRSRYNPAWIPSWFDTNLHPESCEDSLRKTV